MMKESGNSGSDTDDKGWNSPEGDKDNYRPPQEDEQEEDEDYEIFGSEVRSISAAIDELQLFMDRLETHNEEIQQELIQLLQSNREIRMNIKEERESGGASTPSSALGSTEADDRGEISDVVGVSEVPQAKSDHEKADTCSGVYTPRLQSEAGGDDPCSNKFKVVDPESEELKVNA